MTDKDAERLAGYELYKEINYDYGSRWDNWDVLGEDRRRRWSAKATEIVRLTQERDLAIAHDQQPYPTAHAYELACKQRDQYRQERDEAQAEVARLRSLALDELAAESQRLGLYEAPATSSTPPQPGDAVLNLIRGYMNTGTKSFSYDQMRRVFDALDAAQSALTSSQAEVARLTQERDDYRADYLRVHKEKCDLLYPETIARSPTATGEPASENQDNYDQTLHCDNKCLRAGYCMGGSCRNGRPGERYGRSRKDNPDDVERSFSDALAEAASRPVTDELRRVYKMYTDNQQKMSHTDDVERARDIVVAAYQKGKALAESRAAEYGWSKDTTAVVMQDYRFDALLRGVENALTAARREERELHALDEAVIEEARGLIIQLPPTHPARRALAARDAATG